MKQLYKEGKRRCHVCKQILELNLQNFSSDKHSSCGFRYNCKKCTNNGGIRRKIIEEACFKCNHCGIEKQGEYGFFDIDHIEPIRRRGSKLRQGTYIKEKDRGNLQVLCPNCHRVKTINEGYRKQ